MQLAFASTIASTLLVAMASGCGPLREESRGTPTRTVRVVDGVGRVTEIPIDATRTSIAIELDLSMEQAWTGVVQAYSAVGIPVTELDPRAYTLGNPDLRLRGRLGDTRLSRYLDCGRVQGGASANTYAVRLSVSSRLVSATPGVTLVHTQLEATARPSTFSGHDVRCSSTGRLERRIAVEVMVRGRAEPGADSLPGS